MERPNNLSEEFLKELERYFQLCDDVEEKWNEAIKYDRVVEVVPLTEIDFGELICRKRQAREEMKNLDIQRNEQKGKLNEMLGVNPDDKTFDKYFDEKRYRRRTYKMCESIIDGILKKPQAENRQ